MGSKETLKNFIYKFSEYPIVLKLIPFASIFFLSMVIGYEFYYSEDNVAMFWPASGLYLSALLLSKKRNWPWYILVVLVCQVWVDLIYYDRVWYLGILFGVANSLESIIGAIFIRRFLKDQMDTFTFRVIFAVVLGALSAPIFSATVGSLLIVYAYGADFSAYWSIWGVWWAADFLGILIIVPAILAWLRVNPKKYKRVVDKNKIIELCLLVGCLVVIEQYVFGRQITEISTFFDPPYILIPFLLWASFSFSPRVVTTIMFFLAFLVVWNTDGGRGVFVFLSHNPLEVIVAMQSFLSIISISLLYLLVLVNELRNSQKELEKLNQELEDRVNNRTKQLNEMNKELKAFSYSVSHDLQAPLRSIVNFAEVLKEDFQDSLPGDGLNYLERIVDSGFKMQDLIESLLLLSRISRDELDIVSVNISELVKKVIDDLEKSYIDHEPKFYVQVSDCGLVEADVKLLEVAIRNLVTNALKFSKPTQNPEITFGCIEDSSCRIFFVKDNGIGMNMEYSEKIFEPFQRLHTDSEYSGTGIGLSIVQRVIRRHGGSIWVESEIDKGTTFFFTLDPRDPHTSQNVNT
jgi:signal transduction histidine kinase